ncbi:hypothetical protein Taro_029367 [Colocasia esculenta]|uniref:Uncharacterized protein n=1 Tax=Colocasia esculenta TaxID=4460 RepID=A0A843VQY0_COLES|nr:hypothetical protein [Colocasia esculenta]
MWQLSHELRSNYNAYLVVAAPQRWIFIPLETPNVGDIPQLRMDYGTCSVVAAPLRLTPDVTTFHDLRLDYGTYTAVAALDPYRAWLWVCVGVQCAGHQQWVGVQPRAILCVLAGSAVKILASTSVDAEFFIGRLTARREKKERRREKGSCVASKKKRRGRIEGKREEEKKGEQLREEEEESLEKREFSTQKVYSRLTWAVSFGCFKMGWHGVPARIRV